MISSGNFELCIRAKRTGFFNFGTKRKETELYISNCHPWHFEKDRENTAKRN